MDEIEQIPIKWIEVGEHEQRVELIDEEIDALASNIERLGLLYPLHISVKKDRYRLVSGHRRLAACKKLNWSKVPCFVKERGPGTDAEITFAENFHRKNLSPMEQAAAIADCLDEKVLSEEEIAKLFGRSVHWVKRMVWLVDWPPDVQEAVHLRKLSVSAAANLAEVIDNEYRSFLLRNAVEQGATARTTAAWLQAWQSMKPATEAVEQEPVAAGERQVPMVPQAPCFLCSKIFAVNEVSHLPICYDCIQLIRQTGASSFPQ